MILGTRTSGNPKFAWILTSLAMVLPSCCILRERSQSGARQPRDQCVEYRKHPDDNADSELGIALENGALSS